MPSIYDTNEMHKQMRLIRMHEKRVGSMSIGCGIYDTNAIGSKDIKRPQPYHAGQTKKAR